MTSPTSPTEMSSIEKSLLGVPFRDIYLLFPGIIVSIALAWFSIWSSDFIGTTLMGWERSPISSVMMALLLGIIISNLLPLPDILKPGLTFALKKVLRLGIILLGIRLSIVSVFQLGFIGIPIVITCITGALVITTFLNKRMNLPSNLGTLIAVGTSICGVSAIVATGPSIDAKEEEVAYAVAVITIFGLVATILYPFIAYYLFAGDPIKAGLFLGTAIHDTSQVTGAALVFSDLFGLPVALDVATVTKLVRNIFMVAVIPLMALMHARQQSDSNDETKQVSIKKLFPLFILGFLALSIIRSIGDFGVTSTGLAFLALDSSSWTIVINEIRNWATSLLVIALAGVGLSTRVDKFKGLGIKPFIVGLIAAATVSVISFGIITLLGSLIII